MHNKILIPVALDHEGAMEKKIQAARNLLAPGGKITLLTVLESVPGYVAEFVTMKSENHLTQVIKSKLDEMAGDAEDLETAVTIGKPGIEIAEYADDHGFDLIIVASHHPKATEYFLGSTASRVARRAHCSVYILR